MHKTHAAAVLTILGCLAATAGCGEDRETAKRHWHEHVNFYSRESLGQLIEASGYELLAMDVFSTCVAGRDVQVLQAAGRLPRPR